MVLLNLLERLRYCRPRIVVAHVNHELRKASNTEERYLRYYCRKHRLKLVVTHWPKDQHPNNGVENAARVFRYRFFARVMKQERAKVLLTAHHLNDQAETILMRLIRGGDLNELTGIHRVRRFADGYLIRPLLRTPKARLYRYAKVHRVKYYVDRTNYSLKMTRNRMRHLLLPAMARENPQVLSHLGGYAVQLQQLIRNDHLLNRQMAESLRIDHSVWCWTAKLCIHSVNVQTGILSEWLHLLNSRLLVTPPTLREIIKLLNDPKRPQGSIDLDRRTRLVKDYQKFGLSRSRSRGSLDRTFYLRLDRWYRLNDQNWLMVIKGYSPQARAWWDLSPLDLPLRIRASRPADLVRLKNGGHQKVRRVWINQKVLDRERRRSQVLVTRRGQVLSLLDYKSSVLPLNHQKDRYSLMIKKGN